MNNNPDLDAPLDIPTTDYDESIASLNNIALNRVDTDKLSTSEIKKAKEVFNKLKKIPDTKITDVTTVKRLKEHILSLEIVRVLKVLNLLNEFKSRMEALKSL